MYKFEIEIVLKAYYDNIRNEYKKLKIETLKQLYKTYISHEVRQKIDEEDVLSFCSLGVTPNDWKVEIQLYVDIYVSRKFYLCSVCDLREYVKELVNDEQFKKLIFVMFYINDYIKPIAIKRSTISH